MVMQLCNWFNLLFYGEENVWELTTVTPDIRCILR